MWWRMDSAFWKLRCTEPGPKWWFGKLGALHLVAVWNASIFFGAFRVFIFGRHIQAGSTVPMSLGHMLPISHSLQGNCKESHPWMSKNRQEGVSGHLLRPNASGTFCPAMWRAESHVQSTRWYWQHKLGLGLEFGIRVSQIFARQRSTYTC